MLLFEKKKNIRSGWSGNKVLTFSNLPDQHDINIEYHLVFVKIMYCSHYSFSGRYFKQTGFEHVPQT